MALECSCSRILALPAIQFRYWGFPLRRLIYNCHLPHHFRACLMDTAPVTHCHWPFVMSYFIKNQICMQKPLLSFKSYNYFGVLGLKYNSNHKRNCVRDVKYQVIARNKGDDVIKGVHKVIHDRRIKLRQAREGWKQNSKMLMADIQETKCKMKEKIEEIIEVSRQSII